MRTVEQVIVGDPLDEHVKAVVDHLPMEQTAILDLAALERADYMLGADRLEVNGSPPFLNGIKVDQPIRGWLRRLGPPDWQDGIILGSKEAAAKAAWAALLATMIRTTSVEWLTGIDDLNRSENKIAQYKAALAIGVPTPKTVVTSDYRQLSTLFGDSVVIKSLGPGHFMNERGKGRVVFSTEVSTSDERLKLLAGAPFIAQQPLKAASHMRVVVVRGRSWGCTLDATGVPLDWRSLPVAHRAFEITTLPTEIISWAQAICEYFQLGYSSQDWIIDDSGAPWLIDLNPSGQWLFLPEPVASEVAISVARWLQWGAS